MEAVPDIAGTNNLINVYPNPIFSRAVNIHIAKTLRLGGSPQTAAIYDVNGRFIQRIPLQATQKCFIDTATGKVILRTSANFFGSSINS